VADRVYYEPTRHGMEERVAERAERIRAILRNGRKNPREDRKEEQA
jgi:hypothetical protein